MCVRFWNVRDDAETAGCKGMADGICVGQTRPQEEAGIAAPVEGRWWWWHGVGLSCRIEAFLFTQRLSTRGPRPHLGSKTRELHWQFGSIVHANRCAAA